MADQTLASLANTLGLTLQGTQIYNAIQVNPILGLIPIAPFNGDGDTLTYKVMATAATAYEADLESDYTTSAPTYTQVTTTLRNIYAQIDPSIASTTPSFNRTQSQIVSNRVAIARACGRKLLTAMATGTYLSSAIGATATTRGIDFFQPASRNFPTTNVVYFDFNDTGDLLKMSTDLGVTYGTQITCGAANIERMYMGDGQTPENFALVSFDVSDSATGGNWTSTNAATGVTVAASNQIDGFSKMVTYDQMIWPDGLDVDAADVATSPTSANGWASTLTTLDRLYNKVPWAHVEPDRCVLYVPERTEVALRALLVGNATVSEFMGQKLQRNMIGYRGIPIVAIPDLPTDMTIGTTTTGSTIYLVYHDVEKGYHLQYANAAGAAFALNQNVGVASDDSVGSEISLPWYYRELPEHNDGPRFTQRMDGYWTGVCRNEKAIAAAQGFTD
jgi:hypothetical protein